VLEVLEDESPAQPDPVRPLFVETWQQLADVLRELGPSLGDREALRYLGFVASADALAALDALGPEMNIEVSSDGLRRLARVLAPDETGDPLATPEEVDPALRRALGFDAPLPAPEPNPEVEPEPGPLDEPPAPEPEPAPRPSRPRSARRPPRRCGSACAPGSPIERVAHRLGGRPRPGRDRGALARRPAAAESLGAQARGAGQYLR
jgi:hypothetical protein